MVEDYTDEEIRYVFETNFFGAVRTTRAVLPVMRARRRGTIIMMSSTSGLRTFPFSSVYSASKFALEGNQQWFALRAETVWDPRRAH